MVKKSVASQVKRNEQMNARRGLLEELFNDLYKDRGNIYLVNFVRGLFFGLGSVLGGTIVVALIVWIMSFFVQIPLIGPTLEQAQEKIQSR